MIDVMGIPFSSKMKLLRSVDLHLYILQAGVPLLHAMS